MFYDLLLIRDILKFSFDKFLHHSITLSLLTEKIASSRREFSFLFNSQT